MSDDIQIRVMQNEDHDRVRDFLTMHFFKDEPLTHGRKTKEPNTEGEKFLMSHISHGICLLAIQKLPQDSTNQTEKLVGVLISGPKDRSEAKLLFEEAAKMGSTNFGLLLQLLANVERDANVYDKYNVNKVLHVHATSVDTRVRGKGISALLKKEAMVLGKQQGYELMTTDCTSYYSARVNERIGMECAHTVRYSEYLNEEGEQIFCPPAPHECLRSFAIRL